MDAITTIVYCLYNYYLWFAVYLMIVQLGNNPFWFLMYYLPTSSELSYIIGAHAQECSTYVCHTQTTLVVIGQHQPIRHKWWSIRIFQSAGERSFSALSWRPRRQASISLSLTLHCLCFFLLNSWLYTEPALDSYFMCQLLHEK